MKKETKDIRKELTDRIMQLDEKQLATVAAALDLAEKLTPKAKATNKEDR